MKIAFNAALLSVPGIGVSVYAKNLLEALVDIDRSSEYLVFADKSALPSTVAEAANVRVMAIPNTFGGRQPVEQVYIPYVLNKEKPDIFHNPDHLLPVWSVPCKKVITVHDLAFIKYPKTFTFGKRVYKQLLTPGSVRSADLIIAVSQSTKKDLADIFGAGEDKVRVVYEAADDKFKKITDGRVVEAALAKYGISNRYVLFVGTIEPRKNIPALIKAFSSLVEDTAFGHDLVIAGRRGWLWEPVLKAAEDLMQSGRLKLIDNVSDTDLPAIYNGADLFVYPSLYEGFGLPPLEAMACGVPVITSNVSSLPEVTLDAAMLIDPNDHLSLASGIRAVLSDNALRAELSQKGLERARAFTWQKCAAHTLKVYREAAGFEGGKRNIN